MTAWDHLGIGQKPVDRVKWSQISQQQRAFNPVTQAYIHTSREKAASKQELKNTYATLSRARKKEEKYAFGAYDPITCDVKFASKIPKPKPRVHALNMCISSFAFFSRIMLLNSVVCLAACARDFTSKARHCQPAPHRSEAIYKIYVSASSEEAYTQTTYYLRSPNDSPLNKI